MLHDSIIHRHIRCGIGRVHVGFSPSCGLGLGRSDIHNVVGLFLWFEVR